MNAWAQRLQAQWYGGGGAFADSLRPLAWAYGLLLKLRLAAYSRGWLRTESLPVPVIVVGNWIVGGAGKTPTILALLTQLQDLKLGVGVISRGYGRSDDAPRLVSRDCTAGQVGDEPLLIHLRSGVPVAVGRDRVAAARLLLQAHPELHILLSDDGLQHLRLPRDLSVLVFDERGLGNGRLLPAGPLRQAACSRLQAHELVLYNAARPSTQLPGFMARRSLAGAVSLADWWRGEPARIETLHALRGRKLLATAGMAHPQRFFDMLAAEGLTFEAMPLADHFDFGNLPWQRGGNSGFEDVLLTEKDAVKLQPQRCKDARVWVVTLDFSPEQAFQQAVENRLEHLLRPANLTPKNG
ncbi:tetraacyldisaccharide 4'-kinase [Roseateles oligotrophus]|uniref:Tetraacyldisaccharide 4'-kinase n=1 Tax=Roseateles oligotrophus TaxID=1769250 RepID=A0ABT2YH40_9BURK|nr:tetraacyldisaccharide 4'-kinase [Roseateles oligotrophus]MCV2369316.1 tetraacyldisaccharide 4'-kinase [Roseateles oligotrophus]